MAGEVEDGKRTYPVPLRKEPGRGGEFFPQTLHVGGPADGGKIPQMGRLGSTAQIKSVGTMDGYIDGRSVGECPDHRSQGGHVVKVSVGKQNQGGP
jgi:hypothetical protein